MCAIEERHHVSCFSERASEAVFEPSQASSFCEKRPNRGAERLFSARKLSERGREPKLEPEAPSRERLSGGTQNHRWAF